jgi:hypothetical protein
MMASVRRCVVTGPDEHARNSFVTVLRHWFVLGYNDVVTFSTADLQPKPGDDMCFLVMPRSSRYNLWVVGDGSSMVQEIQLMCGGLPQDNVQGGKPWLQFHWSKGTLVIMVFC